MIILQAGQVSFYCRHPEEKEAANREFERAGLNTNYVDGGCYLGVHLGPREELDEWVWPKVEVWYHEVRTPAKIAKRYLQSTYTGLGMLINIEWQYLQRTVPEVGSLMGPLEDALREAFFPAILGGEEVSADLREILGHSMKHGGLGIPPPWLPEKSAYSTPKSASEVLVGSLLRGTDLNYVAHRVTHI